MACSTCKDVFPHEPGKSGLEYSLTEGVTTVLGSDFKPYRIASVLIPHPKKPKLGWYADVVIHGQRSRIRTGSPHTVFGQVKELFVLNGFEYTDLEIWFNLNIQWIERAVLRYQKVQLHRLLELATPNY